MQRKIVDNSCFSRKEEKSPESVLNCRRKAIRNHATRTDPLRLYRQRVCFFTSKRGFYNILKQNLPFCLHIETKQTIFASV